MNSKLNKAGSLDTNATKIKALQTQKSLPSSLKERPDFLTVPPLDIARAKSQELEQISKKVSKEKSKSLEKMEVKRGSSKEKERTKSQEESDSEIAKRKEKQQMLFEAALKQTKTLISPVKDTLPPFPPTEDKILVKTEGDKIIIETKISSKAEDHVFIAKSPKKLDNKLGGKISRSFEDQKTNKSSNNKLNKSMDDKSSQSLEDKFDDLAALQKSPKTLSKKQEIKQQIEGKVVYQKVHPSVKSKSLDRKADIHLDAKAKSKSLDRNYVTPASPAIEDRVDKHYKQDVVTVDVHSSAKEETDTPVNEQEVKEVSPSHSFKEKTEEDSSIEWMTNSQYTVIENDTQTVIMERRKIDIYNKQRQIEIQESKSSQDVRSLLEEKKTEVKRLTSEEESLTEVSELKVSDESNMLGLSLPFIDADSSSDQDQVSKKERKVNLHRERSDDTGSLMTGENEELTADTELPLSDTSNRTSKSKKTLDQQSTFEESSASLVEFLKHESMSQLFSESETDRDVKNSKNISKSMDLTLKFKKKNKIIVTPPQEHSPTVENLPFIDNGASRCTQKSESGEQTGSSGSAHDVSPTETKNDQKTLLTAKSRRSELLKLSAERSRSSESTSWTSIEKDVSPSSANIKGSSIDDESSVSCSIARPLGISQDIEKLNKKDRECLEELKQAMEYGEEHLVSHHTLSSEHSKSNSKSPSPIPELGRIESPRSPSKFGMRKSPTPTLEKQGPVDSLKAPSDSESSSESIERTVEQLSKPNLRKSGLDKIGKCVIEESESSQSAGSKASDVKKDLHKPVKKTKIAITISQEDQNTTIDFDDDGNVITSSLERELMKKRALKDTDQKSSSKSSMDNTITTTPSKGSLSVDDSSSRRKVRLDEQKSSSKSSMDSRGSLSVESRGSFETTESTSGSLGEAYRRGEELKPTWRPFFGASGSENSTSIEEAWIPQDHDGYESLTVNRDVFEYNNQRLLDDFQPFPKNPPLSANTSKDSTEADFTDDLNDFPVNFLYPATSSVSSDVVIGYGQNFGRTLSRISERSTASEKTSADEDSTKACSRSESMNEESLNSSDHQASLSSDPPSNANVAYISDTDRRTSAEMPDIPIDQTKISEMYSESKKDGEKMSKKLDMLHETKKTSDDSQLKKNIPKVSLKQSSASESQESEDWPLPELPPQAALNCESSELNRRKSSEFEEWPSLPSSVLETPIVEKIHIYYMSNEPEQAMKVTIQSESSKDQLESDDDSDTLNNDEELERDIHESKSEKSPDRTTDESSQKHVKAIPYDQSGYMVEPLEKHDEFTCLNKGVVQSYDKSCLSGTLSKATCLMGDTGSCCSRADHKSFNTKSNIEDKVIINQPLKSPTNHSPNFEEDNLYTDDVFGGDSKSLSPDFDKGFSQISNQKFSCGSNNSDTSIDDLLSQTNAEETVRAVGKLSTGGAGTCKRCSHSSHSEEETSSFGTDLDGTVKIGLPQKKCTHSSHSEDTSICLSISEWSTGTNTVRQYANLSASESISAISIQKSDKSDNAATKLYSSNQITKKSEQKPKVSSLAGSSKSSSIDKSSDNIKYDKLCSSETTISKKGIDSSSGTKSDSTLTLAQSISEWSASTSHTLVATAREDHQQVEDVKCDTTFVKESPTIIEDIIESDPTSVPKCESPAKSDDFKEPVLRLTYTGKNDKSSSISYSDKSDKSSSSSLSSLQKHTNGILRFDQRLRTFHHPQDVTHERYSKAPPKSLSYEEQTHKYTKASMRCQSEDSDFKPYFEEPQPEVDIDMPSQLYSQEEKHSERYQSQEFSNIIREDFGNQFNRPDYKPLAKHASYDDKTLSKNQIKEYKISQQYRSKPKSWSFHEHYLASSSELPIITVPEIPLVHKELQEKKSAERSGKTPLSRCSPYYSSSLSSESPPIQPLKAPVKKSLLVRNISLKSPPSGNDTDSSLDVIRDPKERMKTFRRKKPVTSARKRHEKIQDVLEEDSTKSQYSSESDKLQGGVYLTVEENLRRIESSECSDSYLPEVESGSSEMSKGDSQNYDIRESVSYSEDDEQTDIAAKYKTKNYEPHKFPINITPVKFQGFGSSADEDEMGFPRFDRLGRLRHPYLDSQEPIYVSEDSPPRNSYSNKSSRQSSLKKAKSPMFRQPDDKSLGESSNQHQSRAKFYEEQSDRDDSDDYAYPIDTIKRAPKTTKSGGFMYDRETVVYSDTELPQDKDEYEEYRGSPYPEHYEELDMFRTQESYPQYERDTLESREGNAERFDRDLDQRFSLNNVERFYSSHYVDSQASSDSPEQKFDVSTLPPPLCSDDEND
ncbi:unnamed protein product [Parnassius apollo]|uniref:(apollo) hypothetical protein n=1 Tax=Parnassius apollo TaxID=110799 RepID=A0A8S3XJ95_PARAO|nr:unnamed protein product [Parnassius apollo]